MWIVAVGIGTALHALLAAQAEPSLARLYAETGGFTAGVPVEPQVLPDGKSALYLRSGPRDRVQSLYSYDWEEKKETLLLAPDQLTALPASTSNSESSGCDRRPLGAQGFLSFALSDDGRRVLLTAANQLSVLDLPTHQARTLLASAAAVQQPTFSPDGTMVAYVQNNDIHVIDLLSNVTSAVTTQGTERESHGVPPYLARSDMERAAGFWWSPDSNLIAFEAADFRSVEKVALVNAAHPEAEPSCLYYPRPGQALPQVRLGIVSVLGGKTVWVQWDQKKYPWLATVRWSKNAPLTILVQNRAQTEEVLQAVDSQSGVSRRLLTETQRTWLNLDQDFPFWLEDGTGFFWRTERLGAPQIELHARDGSLNSVWTGAALGLNSLAGFDSRTRTLFVNASPNPTESYVYRIFAGNWPTRLDGGAQGGKRWDTARLARDGSVLFTRSASLTALPASVVWKKDGTALGTIPSVALDPSLALKASVQQVGDVVQVWTMVVRPRDFVPGKKYPVLLHVDGGPREHLVRLSRSEHLMLQWFADHGYIVAEIDGRGTSGRGKAWEAAVLNDFASVTIDDQLMGLNSLGQLIAEMDLNHVGLWGRAFGGSLSALMLMKHPELFAAAIVEAPIADWRDYAAHYTERFLKSPAENAAGYAASALVSHAESLSRPLLVVHGTADDNVLFSHSLKLADALLRAGRSFELLPVLGQGHVLLDPPAIEQVFLREAEFLSDKVRP